MKRPRTPLYIVAFAGLAATAAVVIGPIATPTIAPLLLAAAAIATLAGGPGMIHRRPGRSHSSCSRSARTCWPAPRCPYRSDVHGAARSSTSTAAVRSGRASLRPRRLSARGRGEGRRPPTPLAGHVRRGLAGGAPGFLSLRRPLPAIVVFLVLLAFGFTTDASATERLGDDGLPPAGRQLLVLSRSLQRESWKSTDVVAGAITATLAAVLALSIIGATSVEAGRPLRDWRTWDIVGAGSADLRFDWMQNYPRLLDAANDERVMRVRSAVASYWRANALANFDGASVVERRSGHAPAAARPAARHLRLRGPARRYRAAGRVVTESFEVETTYTNDLFIGGWPSSGADRHGRSTCGSATRATWTSTRRSGRS